MKKIIFSIIAIISFAITSLAQVVEITANGPVTFCTGGTVQLTGSVSPSGIYQYQWLKDNVNISGQNALIYVPTSSGVFALKVTALNGSVFISNLITVTINPLPPSPVVTYNSPAIICGGSPIILSDNSSTNVSYQWFFNNNPISNATNNSYAANQPGTYKLVVSHLTTGCSSTSENVIVGEMPKIVPETIVTCGNGATISLTNPNFNFSSSQTSCNVDMSTASIVNTNVGSSGGGGQRKIICFGGNVTINGSGGNVFVVEYGGTLNGFGDNFNGNIAYVKAGGIFNYTNGPYYSSYIIYYEPGALINAGNITTIPCNNIGVIYPSNTTELCNNLTYLWSNGATTPTITVNPSVQTTYTVTVSRGSLSCTDQVVVIPGGANPSPPTITVSGPTALCQGESVVLTSSYTTGNVWSNGATTQSITVTQSGSYTVSYGSCLATSLPKVVTVASPPNNLTVLSSGPTSFCQGGSVTLSLNSLSSVRYLKFESYYSADSGQVNVHEIQALSNGVNVALNKPGFANSYEGGDNWTNNGSNAVDGNTGSRWSSNRNPLPSLTAPHYIVIDLQNQFNLESILLDISSFQQTFSFKVSQDNVNWIEVGNGNSVSGSFTFTPPLTNYSGYLWSNGATTPSITVSNSGAYSVTAFIGSTCSVVSNTLNVTVASASTAPVITTSGPTTLCQGESVTLTSSYPTGNTWSNGATSQSIIVSQSGSYTVSHGACVVTSQPVNVTVSAVPSIINLVPSGPTTICQGSTVSLSLNNLSAIRYLKYECFNNPGGQARVAEIQVLSNGVNLALNKPGYASSYTGTGTWQTNGKNAVDGLSSTTWTSNSSSAPSTTNPQFIVIDLETSQVNIDSILLNIGSFTQTFSFKASQDNINWFEIGAGTSVSGSFTYTPTLTNYSSYLWSNGATTPSITVSESGVYSVTAFIGTTCSVTSNTIAVTANAVPAVPTISTSGSTSLCQGESVVLTSSYSTGNTWSNGATTPSITVTQSGSYTVSVANSNCSSVSQPKVVTVTQVPSSINIVPSGPTTICAGSSVSLSLNSLSAVRYLKYECTYNPGGQARVAEIQAISNGVNLALNKPGYASSYSGTGTWQTNGKNAVDGVSSTIWTSNSSSIPSITNPQFIVIDLETPQVNIESILLNIGSFSQTFSFKVSQDGINWTQIGSGQSVSGTFTYTIPQNTINYSSYLWSNGATTPSISVTDSGAYSVTAYIGSTCSVTSNTLNVLVNPIPVTPTISASGPINICQGESVVLTSSYATGNLWSNGATTQSITVTQSGSYTVINGGCSAPSNPIVVAVASQPSTLLAPNNIVITTSPNQCVASNVNLGLPTGQSCTNYTITNNAPVTFPIGLTVVTWTLVNQNGTTINANQNVTVNFNFDSTSICYVTSDETLPNRNRIYINNANSNNVLEYQILKEVSTNVYNVIGSIPPNQNSYLDLTSNNLTNSNKYKVNTVSICNSSNLNSAIHRTILLQSGTAVNNAVNLSWNPYEGFSYGTFKIYRKIGTGIFELIDTISASNLSYNDINANTLTNTYEYYISIDTPVCNSTPGGRTNVTFSSNQLRSNILNTSTSLGLPNLVLDLGVIIYPNPTSDILNIKIDNTVTYLKTEIYNLIGQKVAESQKTILDVSNLPNASYFVKIITEEGTASKTFIKK
jgi:hypothetical protein